MSNRDEIERRLAAMIEGKDQRNAEAVAKRQAEAERVEADYRAFVDLVDRVILPAIQEFRDRLVRLEFDCQTSEEGIREGKAIGLTHSIGLTFASTGKRKIFGRHSVDFLHFSERLDQVFTDMSGQGSRYVPAAQARGTPYRDVTTEWVLGKLTSRFEEVMKQPH